MIDGCMCRNPVEFDLISSGSSNRCLAPELSARIWGSCATEWNERDPFTSMAPDLLDLDSKLMQSASTCNMRYLLATEFDTPRISRNPSVAAKI